MNIVLIGFRAVGKTVVGRHLAGELGWRFIDCDELIEQAAGRSIRQIFEEAGEAAFRAMEHDVLLGLTGTERAVIATGGGIVVDPRHKALLRALGHVVWLAAGVDVMVRRIGSSERPRLTPMALEAEVAEVYAQRLKLYEDAADSWVDTTGLGVVEVARQVRRAALAGETATLGQVRERIDRVDDALVGLLGERLRHSMQALALKAAQGRGVLDEPREQQVVLRWREAGRRAGWDEADVEAVARAVIALCRRAQER